MWYVLQLFFNHHSLRANDLLGLLTSFGFRYHSEKLLLQLMNNTEAVILLGSNLGDRLGFIRNALQIIGQHCGDILILSSLYESEPWGFTGAGNFLNQVVQIRTQLHADHLLDQLLEIEASFGRIRPANSAYASRVLDLDILYYGNEIIETSQLSIPHPRLHLRKFTLLPLCEILPDFVHPLLNKTQMELLRLTADHSIVSVFCETSLDNHNE